MVPRLQYSPPSIVIIQGNSAGALFDGLLAELSAIFFTSTTSDYVGVAGSHKVAGKTHAV